MQARFTPKSPGLPHIAATDYINHSGRRQTDTALDCIPESTHTPRCPTSRFKRGSGRDDQEKDLLRVDGRPRPGPANYPGDA